jgi:hypothetical protein
LSKGHSTDKHPSERSFGCDYSLNVIRIPIGTSRDWEQGRVKPDQAARADLAVTAREPETVRKALPSASRPNR